MNKNQIANILFNMSLDMDYGDSIEFAKDEIAEIEKSLENINDSLLQCLETIAAQNASLYNWHVCKGGGSIE